MGDVHCGKCGEPWDYYGLLHHDVEYEDGQRILRGEGCPSCDWGKKINEDHQIERLRSIDDETDLDASDYME